MILLTGGSGRLGSELRGRLNCVAPSHAEFDILAPVFMPRIECIVHCAAYTDVLKAESDRLTCYQTNVIGTRRLARYPMVYISTEYVFDGELGDYRESDPTSPVNWYAATKLQGEFEARKAPASLVIRCLFKPRPFQHPRACTDQWTTGDYVDVIAAQVAQCVRWFNAGDLPTHDTLHIGTEKKTTFDLASQTREVSPMLRSEAAVNLPRDTSLNLGKYHGKARHRLRTTAV